MYFYNSLRTRVNRELGYMRRHANLLKGYSVYPETSARTGRIVNQTPTSYRDPLRILWGGSYVIRDRTQ